MRLARLLPAFVAAGALLAACGGSTGSTTTPSATVPSDLSISSFGSPIQNVASQKGVKVISYDRATFTGTNTYYVSFDNVQVGELIGKGFVQCVSDWGVKNAQVFELDGGQNSDPNAVSFAQGYNDAIWG